jgi:serine/threonine protein kinase
MSESSTGKGNELIGQTIDRGRYEVLKVIGEGGMGRVFEAKQINIGRLVAIKVLHAHWAQDPKLLERFRREALTASQFRHPNTVMVYDYGETERGEFYIIMELLQGQSLLSLLDKEGPLSLDRSLKIIDQVCGALSEVHRCGVVHRDLKPENIQIDPRDGHPDFVKLLDFSIAKIVNDNTLSEANKKALTLQGAVFGTPQYMSPEQVRGKPLDHRTDIYAVGVIFYQMLTGQVPFIAETPQGTMMAHLTDPTPDPCALFPELKIHPEAAKLVKDCLVKDPQKRVASAEELSQRVKELAARLELEDPAQHTDVNPSIKSSTEELSAQDDKKAGAKPSSGRRYVTQETEQFDAEVHLTPSAEAEREDAADSTLDPDEAETGESPLKEEPKVPPVEDEEDEESSDAKELAQLQKILTEEPAQVVSAPSSAESSAPEEPAEPQGASLTIRGFGAFQDSADLELLREEESSSPEINPSEGAPRALNSASDGSRARGFLDESIPTGQHRASRARKSSAWPLLLALVFIGSGVGAWLYQEQLLELVSSPTRETPRPHTSINLSTGARDTTYRIESEPKSKVYDLKGVLKSDETPYLYTQATSAVGRLILKAEGYEDRLITVAFTASSESETDKTRVIKVKLDKKAQPAPKASEERGSSSPSPAATPRRSNATPPKSPRKPNTRPRRKGRRRAQNRPRRQPRPRQERARTEVKRPEQREGMPPKRLDSAPGAETAVKAEPPKKPVTEIKVTAEDVVIDSPQKPKRPFSPTKIIRKVPELRPHQSTGSTD